MTRYEKLAWFDLMLFGLTMMMFIALFLFIRNARPEFSLVKQLNISTAAISVIALRSIAKQLLWKSGGRMEEDERDRLIQQRSVFIVNMVFWPLFVGGNMGIWGVCMTLGIEQVGISLLTTCMIFWVIMFWMIRSVTILMLYRYGVERFGGGE